MEVIHSAVSLVCTAFSQLVHDWASTSLTAVTIFVLGWAIRRYGTDWRQWRSAVSADRKARLIPALVVMAAAWALVFLFVIANVIYSDHVTARQKINKLSGDLVGLQDANNGLKGALDRKEAELSSATALINQYKVTELTKGPIIAEPTGDPNCSRLNLHLDNTDFTGSFKSLVAADGCANVGVEAKDTRLPGKFSDAVIKLNTKPAKK